MIITLSKVILLISREIPRTSNCCDPILIPLPFHNRSMRMVWIWGVPLLGGCGEIPAPQKINMGTQKSGSNHRFTIHLQFFGFNFAAKFPGCISFIGNILLPFFLGIKFLSKMALVCLGFYLGLFHPLPPQVSRAPQSSEVVGSLAGKGRMVSSEILRKIGEVERSGFLKNPKPKLGEV